MTTTTLTGWISGVAYRMERWENGTLAVQVGATPRLYLIADQAQLGAAGIAKQTARDAGCLPPNAAADLTPRVAMVLGV